MAFFSGPASDTYNRNRDAAQVGGVIRYPHTLPKHGMMFQFIDYKYSDAVGAGLVNRIPNTSGAIVLPLPTELTDTQSIGVNADALGATGALGADMFKDGIPDLKNAGGKAVEWVTQALGMAKDSSIDDVSEMLLSTANLASKFFGRMALDSIAPGLGLAADNVTATAVNPHATINFNGVPLKMHTFSWTLSPSNPSESATVSRIIKTIKQKSLPTYNDLLGDTVLKRAILNYPSLVQIELLGVDQEAFYKFKPAMIMNIGVSYGSGGSIPVAKGGKPAVVTLSLSLIEATIHTSEDYGGHGTWTWSGSGGFDD